MFITEKRCPALLSSFCNTESKRSVAVPKNLERIARCFHESLLRRLECLDTVSNPAEISLSWMCLAVEVVTSIHADAKSLILNLMISHSFDVSVCSSYFDDSVKLLDVCNSISKEVELLKHRRLTINFILHLLKSDDQKSVVAAPEKLRKARDSLADWKNSAICFSKRSLKVDTEALMRNHADKAAYRKITTVEKLIASAIFSVRLVTVLIIGSITSTLNGSPELEQVLPPLEFLWTDSFNSLRSNIVGKLKVRFGGIQKKCMFDEIDNLTKTVAKLSNTVNNTIKVDEMQIAVKNVEKELESFSNGVDGLSNGVNKLFDTVMGTRNGMLENYGQQKLKRKYSMSNGVNKSLFKMCTIECKYLPCECV